MLSWGYEPATRYASRNTLKEFKKDNTVMVYREPFRFGNTTLQKH